MSSMGTFNFVSIETLTGNTGGKIHAVASNISILGAGGLTVAGNATLGTLTISGPGGPTGNLVTGFITDVGGNVVPTILGVVDLAGGNNITVSGSVLNTATFHLTGTTDHAVQLGNATGSLTSLAAGTTAYVLTSNGADSDPSWQASVNSVTGGTNISTSGTAADPVVDLDATITLTTVNATTFDTNIAAARVTLAGSSLLADGTDADIDINITSKGIGHVVIDDLQLTTDLAVTEGGTGVSTLTDHSVLLGAGTAAITSLTVGAAGEILTGVLNSDPAWLAAGTADQVLTAHGAASAVTWETPSDLLTINAQVGTTYTLALTDSSKLITLSNASPITLTIPLNSSIAFSIGTQILINQLGAGNATVAATGGVTINSYDSDVSLSGQHSVAGLIKIGTDLWILFGDIT